MAVDSTAYLQEADLWGKALAVYDRAQAVGAATKTESREEIFSDGRYGVDFVLRVVAALRTKPAAPASAPSSTDGKSTDAVSASKAWKNPFLPYEEDLWVGHLSPNHTLLLNKFNVVAHHVLVVTRAFESQSDPLNASDLAATMQVLQAIPQGGLAFFNCGEHSGRSQPHKHLQLVPLPLARGQPPVPPMQPVLDAAFAAAAAPPLQPVALAALPFRAYAARLPARPTPEQLEAVTAQLLSSCAEALPAPVSYNVLLTQQTVMVVPRRAEKAGPCAINALGFAGTILLKSNAELDYTHSTGPMAMLAAVGWPWPS